MSTKNVTKSERCGEASEKRWRAKKWSVEKTRQFKSLREKRRKKVAWLKKKYHKPEVIPDSYEQVCVADQVLEESFTVTPQCYGGVVITTEESKVLKLHPKFTTYENVDIVECEAEIEKAFTKIRWERSREKKNNNKNDNEETEDGNTIAKTPYNIDTREFNFRIARATDLPFNASTYTPQPIAEEEEIQIQSLKLRLLKVAEEYSKENRNKLSNLSQEEREGLKSLQERRDNKEVVMFQTDKSGKISIDTPENYIEAATPHTENDTVISVGDYHRIENEINAHSTFWLKMLQVAVGTGDADRYKRSMLNHNSEYATLYTYRKDHKECEDEILGPPVRPLCDVSDSYGHKLSYFITKILKEVCEDERTICESTEDMMASMKETNDRGCLDADSVVGSLDVKALYPSLDIDFTVEIACSQFYSSGVKIVECDYQELGLYLSLNRSSTYLQGKGLLDFCPRRKTRFGAPPTMTGSGKNIHKAERFKAWITPTKQPNDEEKRRMMKEALQIVLLLIMKNHVYSFNGELKRQNKGGAIGVDLTGVLAQIFMTWWDKEFLKRLGSLAIEVKLYKRYVDDINLCITATKPGVKYHQGRLVTEETDADPQVEKDKRTFEVIKDIGESIHTSIQLTTDVPSNHEDGRIPILDLQVWIEECNTGGEGTEYVILHEHYVKKVSSKMVIHMESAMCMNTRRTILTQQCLRVMLNCSKLIGWERISKHLTSFMARMQASGYDKSLRYEVLKSAIVAYKKIKEADEKGEKPMYRPKEWQRNRRRKEKEEKRRTWYTKGGYTAVLFVPATPESKLKKQMQKEITRTPLKIKVVEQSGTKVIKLLQKNDPFKEQVCNNKDKCMVCSTAGKGSCRASGVTYEIKCLGNCSHTYIGQTSANAYTRGEKHQDDYEHKRSQSTLWKHVSDKHSRRKQRFSMSIVDRCRNDPTKRQILEALRIRKANPTNTMNERGEWNQINLPRVAVTR